MGILYIFVDLLGNENMIEYPVLGFQGASNNQMELNACIVALKNIPTDDENKNHFKKIIIFTDSQYVVKNYQNAIFKWPQNKWLKKSGAPVLNAELWKQLYKFILHSRKHVEIRKVKGHSKDIYNKRVDKLAKTSAKNAYHNPLVIKKIRRKISKEKTVIGSVVMEGQRMMIRVIESEYLPIQKIDRYRYEVMSRASKYYGKVDFLCSTEQMNAGHMYSVRLNTDNTNPSIAKLFKEVIR